MIRTVYQVSKNIVVYIEDSDSPDWKILKSASIDSGIPLEDLKIDKENKVSKETIDVYAKGMADGTWYSKLKENK